LENPAAKKKSAEKALIPLPPAGFGMRFCENVDVDDMRACSKPAVSLGSRIQIATNEKICKEM
jgi:hypothetical protein